MTRDDDLIAFYEAEAKAGTRAGRQREPHRVESYERFRELLGAESRRSLLDVGAGPGVDSTFWSADGIDVVGVDLAIGNVVQMSASGIRAVAASLHALPFPSGTFDAVWTMSTLVHVPDSEIGAALHELVRVASPGAPLGIGSWGGLDFEGVPEFGEIRPRRFFALRNHARWRRTLELAGSVEQFQTFPSNGSHGWEYQFAILRSPSRSKG